MFLKADIRKNILQFFLAEDLGALLFEDRIFLAAFVGVDRVDDCVNAIKDVTLDWDPAIGHDLFHFLAAHIEIFVEIIHYLFDDDSELIG